MNLLALVIDIDVVWWLKTIGLGVLFFLAGVGVCLWYVFKDWRF